MNKKVIISNLGIPLGVLVLICLVGGVIGNIGFNDKVVAKGENKEVRSIIGNICSMSVEQAKYDSGIITIESFVLCQFTDSQFQEIFDNCEPSTPMGDACLSGTIKGLLQGHIYLENKNGITREPIYLSVDADSEIKSASLKIAFDADDKDEYTLNVESYETDTQKKVIKFSLK
ncbi:MAG: hypothetical protein PHT78_08955 [Desulfitobacteriaceae bacterium]|nr:hypothetical protein [Desulfitobacteriaceae bacterium]